MSGGWTPAVHLFSQSRGKLAFDAARDAFVPGLAQQAVRNAGACDGAFGLAECLAQGHVAGAAAAGIPGTRLVRGNADFHPRQAAARRRQLPARARRFVDFQNDVTAKDIALAVREGFDSIEHVKRYTTAGMATDQGKTSSMNALDLVAGALGQPAHAIGTTTFRPPYTPVTFGALAGANRDALFDPVRTTPMHDWAEANGAVFEDVGQWKRAWYFPRRQGHARAPSRANARRCAAASACSMPPRSARSKSPGPTPPNS